MGEGSVRVVMKSVVENVCEWYWADGAEHVKKKDGENDGECENDNGYRWNEGEECWRE